MKRLNLEAELANIIWDTHGAPRAAGAAAVRPGVVEAEPGGGGGAGAGVGALSVAPHAALIDVPAPAVSRPAGESWEQIIIPHKVSKPCYYLVYKHK